MVTTVSQPRFGLTLLLAVSAAVRPDQPQPLPPLRPPAVPLAVVTPYLSVWSVSDNLADTWPSNLPPPPSALLYLHLLAG